MLNEKTQFENLTALYQYFDELVENDADADTLFASSYLRGFISLAGSEYGGEEQPLTVQLAENIDHKLHDARRELSPQDKVIVNQFWQHTKMAFNA